MTDTTDRLDDLRAEYANTGMVTSDGAVWLFSQIVVLREQVQHLKRAAAVPPVDRAAPTDWIDGHPQLEAIASAVWEKCGRSDSGMCVEDDPRNIAVAALGAVLAVLPEPADQAAVLAEAIARVEDPEERAKTTTGLGLGWEAARDVLRRMADEAQPGTEAPCTCADAGACFAPAGHYADCPAAEAQQDGARS